MHPVPLPANEADRLESLRAHDILDTAADSYLDSLTRIVAHKLHVPIVLVNLVDSERQWAKAAFGLPRGYELSRELAFCSYTILTPGQPTVIADTVKDARVANNPFVTGKARFRSYAGAPVTDIEGRALGALCAIDTTTREFTAAEINFLLETAESVSARLELYRANSALRESEQHYRSATELNPHMLWSASAAEAEKADARWLALVGTPNRFSTSTGMVRAVHPEDLSFALEAWSASVRDGRHLDLEYRLRLSDGGYRWFRVRASPRRDTAGRIMRWYGTVEDIHERRMAEVIHQETLTRLDLALEVGRLRTWELDLASRRLTASDVSVINFGLQLGVEISDYDAALARMHPDDEQRYGREVERAWAAGKELEIEYRNVWPDGTVHWVRINGRPTRDAEGKPVRLIGLSLDITAQRTAEEERQRAEARMAYLAHHDTVTGLANRRLFHQLLSEALASGTDDAKHAVLRIDLDDFKAIDAAMGHEAGDKLLQIVAERFKENAGQGDLVARYGSDEFAVLASGSNSDADVDVLAHRLLRALAEPIALMDKSLILSVSAGISLATGGATSAIELLRNANTALSRAKAAGRGTCQYFEPSMDTRLQTLTELRLSLGDALLRSEFRLYYQPLVNLRNGEITSFEALIRWQHPSRGLVSPADFIPLAEETGWIVPIGYWVLREACREAATWPDTLSVAVNLSAVQFGNKDLVTEIRTALEQSGLASSRLEFEVTETLLLQDDELNTKLLWDLKELGVRIAMDDFGTGYSSLGYLRRFPFNKIKIDQSFIRDLPDGAGGDAIVQATIGLAHSLGLSVTAEGVETHEQLDFLRDHGCEHVQGYLLSRPVPPSEIPLLLTKNFKQPAKNGSLSALQSLD